MNQFSMEVSSDLDYEKLVVNLNLEDNQVAILSSDQGPNEIRIEFLDKYTERKIWNLELTSFLKALATAVEQLKEVND